MDKPDYQWSYFYSEKSLSRYSHRHTLLATQKLISIFLCFLGAAFLYFKIHSFSCESFSVCAGLFFKTPRFLILSLIYLMLLLFTFTPLEKILFKKDDLSFLEKIPDEENISFRSVEIYHDEVNSELLIELVYKKGKKISSEINHTMAKVLSKSSPDTLRDKIEILEDFKNDSSLGAEQKIKIILNPMLVEAMGWNKSFEKLLEKIDAETIPGLGNKHLAFFLELVFYGKIIDLEKYLSFIGKTKDPAILKRNIEQVFSYFSNLYHF